LAAPVALIELLEVRLMVPVALAPAPPLAFDESPPNPPNAALLTVSRLRLFWVNENPEVPDPALPAIPLLLAPPPLPPMMNWRSVRLPVVEPLTALLAEVLCPLPAVAPLPPKPPSPPPRLAVTVTDPPRLEVPLMAPLKLAVAPLPPVFPAPCAWPPFPAIAVAVTLIASGPALVAVALATAVPPAPPLPTPPPKTPPPSVRTN
jgi:hypothetical protein